jgi:hypothetical protein
MPDKCEWHELLDGHDWRGGEFIGYVEHGVFAIRTVQRFPERLLAGAHERLSRFARQSGRIVLLR